MKVAKVIAMELPNGSHIEIEHSEGKYTEKDGSWETVNVNLKRADGYTHTICCFDFDGSSDKLLFTVLDENANTEEDFALFETTIKY